MSKQQPVLTLKRIDPVEIGKNYLAGKYSQLTVPTEQKKVDKQQHVGCVHTYKDRNGTIVKVYLPTPLKPEQNRCRRCKQPFVQGYGDPKEVRVYEQPASAGGMLLKIWTMQLTHHTLNCAHSDFIERGSSRGRVSDPNYAATESLYQLLSFDLTGSTKIKPAPDPEPLLSGQISPSVYDEGLTQYAPLPNAYVQYCSPQFMSI